MRATATLRIGLALLPAFLVSPAAASTTLQIVLQVDAGTPVTIADGNDGVNDLNAADGVIDFSTTVDGVLQADGRVEQANGPIRRALTLGARTIAGQSVFHNLDAAAHTITVTLDSATFIAPGPPLGWHVLYQGTADDAAAGDVELAPRNDVDGYADPGSGFGAPLNGTPVAFPITPPVAAADQPVAIDAGQRGVDATGDAVRTRLVWTFDAGPRDEVRLPNGQSFVAMTVAVFNAQSYCVYKMNNDATAVVSAGGAGDAKCIRTNTGGDATACVDDQADTTKKEDRLLADFAFTCATPPAFGANLGTCCQGGNNDGDACTGPGDCASGACTAGACISGAAEDAVNAVTHDLFGATVNVSDPFERCQLAVAKAAANLHTTRWRAFTACKRRHIATLATEADFVTTCLGPPQPDTSNKIAKSTARLAKAVSRRCIDRGAVPLSTVFPGACASETDADYPACIGRQVACRFCRGARDADDIVAPLDCDVFDDGTANGSCP